MGWTGRDERCEDLFFVDPSTPGNPTEEGQVRSYSGDLVAFIDGQVKSLTSSTSLLGKAIFLVDGGLVYDTDGDVMIKVSE